MAGLYVHIPFCKKRCLYCDFYSTTLLVRRAEYVEALIEEIKQRKDEAAEPIRTIYLGGGTPSTLEIADIARILQTIGIQDSEEITMEMNPGDVTKPYLDDIRNAGVNRISIGIQTFDDELLARIGRRHSANQAVEAVRMAKQAGFDNISIDLIYALPGQTMVSWERDIEIALQLGVQHISSYGLIYEEGTALTRMRDEGAIEPIDEETENTMYDVLCMRLKEAGFVHYEVSNFALSGFESKHNSSYWNGTPYIGVGAGAHSFIRNVRSWNPDDLDAYIRGSMAHDLIRESETLTERDRYNEYVMLGLRTDKGVDMETITSQDPCFYDIILDNARRFNLVITEDKRILATQKGIHILNRIIEQLMI